MTSANGTHVGDVVAELRNHGCSVDVLDPWADAAEAEHEYGIDLIGTPEAGAYGGIVLAVAHDAFRVAGPATLRGYGRAGGVFCDRKSVFARDDSDLRL
jgi:UDP-N-acetyl-D-glucosamine/UDP-N-acetyl-D-galactosamine dehydrogenase